VSTSIKYTAGNADAASGLVLPVDESVNVSAAVVTRTDAETVAAVVESDFERVGAPAVVDNVIADPLNPTGAACEGAELSTPRPKAATATSAMRLKFVVVDICFLSLVVTRNFLIAASR
jgi:hypothetical protein